MAKKRKAKKKAKRKPAKAAKRKAPKKKAAKKGRPYGVKIGSTWIVIGTIDRVAMKAHVARVMRQDKSLTKVEATKVSAAALLRMKSGSPDGEALHSRFSFGDYAGDEIRQAIGEAEGLVDENDEPRSLTVEEADNRGRDNVIAQYLAL